MLFCERLSDQEWALAHREERQHQVQEIVSDFSTSFSPISFRLQLEFRLINAQAVTVLAGRHVNIYGGLAFHPELGPDALVLVILHEAGHHLSKGPRSPQNATLACECAADFWSVTEGPVLLKQRSGRHFGLGKALGELSRILPDGQISSGEENNSSRWCWCRGWSVRKDALLGQRQTGLSCCNYRS
jgi:hypothetical protein